MRTTRGFRFGRAKLARIIRMKHVIPLIAAAALAFTLCSAGCSYSDELVSKASEKLSPAVEKVKELLPSLGDKIDRVAAKGEDGGRALLSLGDIVFAPRKIASANDFALVPTDDYGMGYVFEYDGEEFTAYFDSTSWRVYDSYKITNRDDIIVICQALIDEHPVYGSDWESLRTAEDMAYEWEQHNLAYKALPEDSHWRDDARNVDLDPDDQGKSFRELYEDRTGKRLDIGDYLNR